MNIDPTKPLTAQLQAHGIAGHCAGATALTYRFRDARGDLLYVGVTVNAPTRWQAHRNTAEWWPLVACVEVETHPYMNAALDAEVQAIRTEFPRFNLRSAAERPAGDSAGSRGTPPQGKGREEEWNGERRTHHPLLTTGGLAHTPAAAVNGHPAMDGATRWGGEW